LIYIDGRENDEMETKKPNIIIFMADHYRGDMAPPFFRCKTPNLNAFYEDAAAFTNAFCPSPHCCPSRATFQTGLYPSEHGVWNNVNVDNRISPGLYDGVGTWSQVLAKNGYSLYHCGKWHVSNEKLPQDFGWEYVYGNEKASDASRHARPGRNEWARYANANCHTHLNGRLPAERAPGQLIREGYPNFKLYGETEKPFGDEGVVDAAVDVIRTRTDDPYVLFCGVLGPHDPYNVPKKFLDLYDINDIELPPSFYDNMLDKPNLYRRTRDRFGQMTPEEYRQAIRHYLAFCSYEDSLFGRVIEALKETGRYDDTIVFFTSDHGDYCGEHGMFAKGLPCFKSAYNIPLLVRWPGVTGKPDGQVINNFAGLADFAPTVLEMAGVAYGESEYSGKSLVPLLTGKPFDRPDEAYTQTNGNELYGIQRSVTTREWKYVYNGFDYDELYDLTNDPHEMRNLAGFPEYRQVLREMTEKMWAFASKHGDTCVNSYVMVSLCEFGPGIVV
jgi:arylsulfatase A-like enzyme